MVPMIAYSQNGEDVLLRRVFPDHPDGFYIDVGASLSTAVQRVTRRGA